MQTSVSKPVPDRRVASTSLKRGLTEAQIADDLDQGQQQYEINTVYIWLW